MTLELKRATTTDDLLSQEESIGCCLITSDVSRLSVAIYFIETDLIDGQGFKNSQMTFIARTDVPMEDKLDSQHLTYT